MRGAFRDQGGLFSYISPEARVPEHHPLRKIRELVREVLKDLSRTFGKLYASEGRPSIPPEQLLSALLLQVFYGIRSERQLMEQLNYNLLYRWFVGLSPDDPVWDPTTFTKNRERLQNGDVFQKFMTKLLNHSQVKPLLSDEHFSVDGTLIEAWASQKSFRAAAAAMARTFPKRSAGTTPMRARAIRRAVFTARRRGGRRSSATWVMPPWRTGADHVAELRGANVTPHLAQNNGTAKTGKARSSAIDARTTRHAGYGRSQTRRKMIECIFGWGKQHGTMRKTKHRGILRVGADFILNLIAYNLIRIPRLIAA